MCRYREISCAELVQACLDRQDGGVERLAQAYEDGMPLQIPSCDIAVKLLHTIGTQLPRLEGTASAGQLLVARLFQHVASRLPGLIAHEGDCTALLSPGSSITQLHADALLVIVHAFGRHQAKCLMLANQLRPLAKVDTSPNRERLLLAMLAVHPAVSESTLAIHCFRGVWLEYQELSVVDPQPAEGPSSMQLMHDMRPELEQLMAHVVKYMPDVLFQVLTTVQLEDAGRIPMPCSAPALLVETSHHRQPVQLCGYSAADLLFPWWAKKRKDETNGSVWRPVLYALISYGVQGLLSHALLMLLLFMLWASASLLLVLLLLFVAVGTFLAQRTSDWGFQSSCRSLLGKLVYLVRSVNTRANSPMCEQHQEPLSHRAAERVPVPYWALFRPDCVLNPLLAAGSGKALVFNTPLLRAYITHRWHYIGRFVLAAQLAEHITLMAIFITYAVTTSRRLTDVLDEEDGAAECVTRSEYGFLATLGLMTFEAILVDLQSTTAFAGGAREWFWLLLDQLSSLLMLSTIIYHGAGCTKSEAAWSWGHIWDWRAMAACQTLLLFLRLLYFTTAVPLVGSFAQMMLSVMRDMYPFMYVLCTVFVGFSVCFSVLTGAAPDMMSDNTEQAQFEGRVELGSGVHTNITLFSSEADVRLVADDSVGAVFMTMFTLIFGGLDTEYLGQSLGPRRVGVLWAFLKALYQVLVAIVLLNILIAIINSSYGQVDGMRPAIELRNKAVLIVKAEGLKDTDAWNLSAVVCWILQKCGAGVMGRDAAGHTKGLTAMAWAAWDADFNRQWMFVVDGKAQAPAPAPAQAQAQALPPQDGREPAGQPSSECQAKQMAQLQRKMREVQNMLQSIIAQLPAQQQGPADSGEDA